MITIGVQTKGFLPERDIEEAFDIIARAGFDKIDFNMDAFLKSDDVYKGRPNSFFDYSTEELICYFDQYKKVMREKSIECSQMHAPYPFLLANRIEQNKYMQEVVIPKSLLVAKSLEVPWVVLHPCKLRYAYGVEREFEENLKYYQSLIPILKKLQIGICVENLYENTGGRITEGPCADPKEAIAYVDILNEMAGEELFGICVDTGHLQLTKRDIYEYITVVGKRLKILHLHENDAIGDLHQMPFSFGRENKGGLDWVKVALALREIGFDGTLSFETHPCVRAFPESTHETVLETICGVGKYLKDIIEKGE